MSLLTIKVVIATFGITGAITAIPLGILASKGKLFVTDQQTTNHQDSTDLNKYCPNPKDINTSYAQAIYTMEPLGDSAQQDDLVTFKSCV